MQWCSDCVLACESMKWCSLAFWALIACKCCSGTYSVLGCDSMHSRCSGSVLVVDRVLLDRDKSSNLARLISFIKCQITVSMTGRYILPNAIQYTSKSLLEIVHPWSRTFWNICTDNKFVSNIVKLIQNEKFDPHTYYYCSLYLKYISASIYLGKVFYWSFDQCSRYHCYIIYMNFNLLAFAIKNRL